MKKILSLVLVIALVLGSFSFAFATPSDVVDTDYEEAVETLIALGVVNGYPDGTYKPAKVVTRAEMAKLLIVELGYEELAGGTANFSDTAGHWAEGYIALAAGLGIVNGYPDGTFKADNTVSFDEALTMVIRGAGYTDESLTGTWPTNYKIKAINLDLLDDVAMKAAGADRGSVAQILFNALDLVYGEVNADGDFEKNVDGDKIIDKIGEKVEDVAISFDDIFDEDDALDTVIDLMPYLYHTITYYENADGDIAYVSDMETNELEGVIVDTDDNGGTAIITVEDADDDETEFDVTSSTALYFNGDETTSDFDATELDDDESCTVKVVYDDDDNVMGIVAWDFELVQITTEFAVRRPVDLGNQIQLPADLDDDDDEYLVEENLTIVGDADELEDIEEDDLVYVYASQTEGDVSGHPEMLKLEVVREVVEGVELTEVDAAGDDAVFDGDDYDLSDFAVINFNDLDSEDEREYPLGEEYDLILDKDGDVYDMEEADSEETVEGYAVYVSDADGDIDTDEFDTSEVEVDDAPRVKVFTDGGDVVIYDLDTEDLDLEDGSTYDYGDVEVEVDGSDIVVTTAPAFRALVEIELNNDGEVTEITVVGMAYSGSDFDEDDMLLEDLDVLSSTLVFDVQDDDEDEWKVVDADVLVDDIEGDYEYDADTFEVEVMTVVDGMDAGDTYAAVTKVVSYYDGSDTVDKITALVDGEEEVFLAEEDVDMADALDEVVILEFDGDRVESYTTVEGIEIEVDSIDSIRVREAGGDLYTMDDDAVVIIIDEGDFIAGEISDVLEGDDVELILDADDEVQVIILNLDTLLAD